jgi:hypothetical protein
VKTRSASALAHWILVGTAGLAGTLAFTAVQASRVGCADSGTTDLIAVGGIAGFGLALASLLLVGAVSRYRSAAAAVGALTALGLSTYAIVTFLTRDGASCF